MEEKSNLEKIAHTLTMLEVVGTAVSILGGVLLLLGRAIYLAWR